MRMIPLLAHFCEKWEFFSHSEPVMIPAERVEPSGVRHRRWLLKPYFGNHQVLPSLRFPPYSFSEEPEAGFGAE